MSDGKSRAMTERLLSNPGVKKAYESAWYAHSRMFGSVMDNAFVGDDCARLDLAAALNYMSRGKTLRARKRLLALGRFCSRDEDLIAWLFFMGLYHERCGEYDRAIMLFTQAAAKEPPSHLVYLMLARCLHHERQYGLALPTYELALQKLEAEPPTLTLPAISRDKLSGSIHGNMASCCVMMRLYNEAEYELIEAEELGFSPPGSELIWALLCAATDRKTEARSRLARLRELSPEREAAAVLRIEEILSGKSPHFCLIKPDMMKLEAFWGWFSGHEDFFYRTVTEGMPAFACRELTGKLFELFGSKDETVRVTLERDNGRVCLGFIDGYSLSYEIWLGRLVDLAPAELKPRWSFYVTH